QSSSKRALPGDVVESSFAPLRETLRTSGATRSRFAETVRASARARPPLTVKPRLRSRASPDIVIWIGCHQVGSRLTDAAFLAPERCSNPIADSKLRARTGSAFRA